MAKRLNKNLIIGLAVLGFTVTTAAGILMVKELQQKDPAEFVKRADEMESKEDWRQASQYYMRAYRATLVSEEPEPI